jgi:hypothetical protein
MIARLLLFLLIFSVEIRVEAARISLAETKSPVLEPADCLSSKGICAIKTPEQNKFVLKIDESEFVMDSNSTIVRASATEIKLITGTVWVKSKTPITISTAFVDVISQGGEFWVTADSAAVHVSAIDESLLLNCKDKKTALKLEVGEENWVAGIDKKGESTSGVPRAIAFEDHLMRWARLYTGTKTQFESDVKNFHSRWERGLASVADYNKQLADARLKVLDDEAAKRAQIKAQEETRSAELRALFRRKQLLD